MEQIKLPEHYYKYWKGLIRPRGFEVDKDSLTPNYGKFYVRPLERGYGLTLGNAVRRVLLSSMMGSAVSAVKFKGVLHEFTTIEGVLEDVTDVILNLKAVRFRQEDQEDKKIRISKKGPCEVKASDIQLAAGIEILNPEAHIATLNHEGELEVEIIVSFDRGYVEAKNRSKKLPVGYIPIDSIHSPIRRVNYNVNSASVGKRTDYDALVLEVWTDGSLRPDEAVPLSYKILKEQLQVFINFNEDMEPVPQQQRETHNVINENLFRPADDLELSVRSANCLKNARIRFIGDLVTKTEQDMLRTKNFGRKSLNEIKAILKTMGLNLGMEVDGWASSKSIYQKEIQEKEAAAQVDKGNQPQASAQGMSNQQATQVDSGNQSYTPAQGMFNQKKETAQVDTKNQSYTPAQGMSNQEKETAQVDTKNQSYTPAQGMSNQEKETAQVDSENQSYTPAQGMTNQEKETAQVDTENPSQASAQGMSNQEASFSEQEQGEGQQVQQAESMAKEEASSSVDSPEDKEEENKES